MGKLSTIFGIVKAAGSIGAKFVPWGNAIVSAIEVTENVVTRIKERHNVPISGEDKKQMALDIAASSIAMMEGIRQQDLFEDEAFLAGLSKAIDGYVEMANATLWAKGDV
jgi:hypothetical protein